MSGETRTCAGCGKEFQTVHRSDQKHCKPACRWRAYCIRQAILMNLIDPALIQGTS